MRLIAIDLDGTLLNSNKEITSENLESLRAAERAGATIVIATGRFSKDAWRITEHYNLNTWHICSNGAAIYTPDKHLFNSITMNSLDVEEALAWLSDHGYYFEIATEKTVHAWQHQRENLLAELPRLKEANPSVDIERLLWVMENWKSQKGLTDIPTISALLSLNEEWHNILTIVFDPKRRQDAMDHFKRWNKLTLSYSWSYNFELMAKGVSKGNALEILGRELGISLSEMMSIGDNHNDLSMLSKTGLSIAMGNSTDEIKSLCTFTTHSHDENGVAHAIQENFLKLLK